MWHLKMKRFSFLGRVVGVFLIKGALRFHAICLMPQQLHSLSTQRAIWHPREMKKKINKRCIHTETIAPVTV